MTTLAPGTRLRSYQVTDLVGQGSMAAVYRVLDRETNLPWAMKEMNLESLDEDQRLEKVEWFLGEMSILLQQAHPAFPLVIDTFTHGDCLYLVMELVDGRTLEEVVQQNGPTPEAYLLPLAQELAVALEVLHGQAGAPIIFRDLKPSNVMVADDGTVKLIDFGIARVYKPGKASDTQPLGSPGFAPPEQWGSAQTTPRSDLYALGATLYYALTGTDVGLPGQDHPPLRQRAPGCSEKMEALLERCLQADPLQRPASASEVLGVLEAIPRGTPILGVPRRRQRSLLRRWLAGSYGWRFVRIPDNARRFGWSLLVLAMVAMLMGAFVRNFIHARAQGQLTACRSNLREIGTALNFYGMDNQGRYPPELHVPGLLRVIPSCPACGSNTYAQGFTSSAKAYTVVCTGLNHEAAGQGANFPQYTSAQGLITQ